MSLYFKVHTFWLKGNVRQANSNASNMFGLSVSIPLYLIDGQDTYLLERTACFPKMGRQKD